MSALREKHADIIIKKLGVKSTCSTSALNSQPKQIRIYRFI